MKKDWISIIEVDEESQAKNVAHVKEMWSKRICSRIRSVFNGDIASSAKDYFSKSYGGRKNE